MSEQPKWTPGPWMAHEMQNLFQVHPVGVKAGYAERVADVIYWSKGHSGPKGNPLIDSARANAHLISAAPDLYAALQRAGRYFPHSVVACRGDKCREPWCVSCCGEDAAEEAMLEVEADIAAHRAALAKARGETK